MTSTNTCESLAASAPLASSDSRPLRLLVIHNPAAGWRCGRRLAAVLDALRRRGCAITGRETTRRGDAEAFAGAARLDDYDRIAIACGDGTINHGITGLGARPLPVAVRP